MNQRFLSMALCATLLLSACASTNDNMTSEKTMSKETNKAKVENTVAMRDASRSDKVVYSRGVKEIVANEGTVTLDKKEKRIVCKKTHKVGTRLGKQKVCMTKTEYDKQLKETQKSMESFKSTGGSVSGGGN